MTPKIMRCIAIGAAASGLALAACAHHVRSAPELTQSPPVQPARPPEKNFLDKAADTTWTVVSAPVRWVTPQKKVVPPREAEVQEPANAVIMGPGGMVLEPPPASQPAAAQAATQTR